MCRPHVHGRGIGRDWGRIGWGSRKYLTNDEKYVIILYKKSKRGIRLGLSMFQYRSSGGLVEVDFILFSTPSPTVINKLYSLPSPCLKNRRTGKEKGNII